jgi:hypothetical protein
MSEEAADRSIPVPIRTGVTAMGRKPRMNEE